MLDVSREGGRMEWIELEDSPLRLWSELRRAEEVEEKGGGGGGCWEEGREEQKSMLAEGLRE